MGKRIPDLVTLYAGFIPEYGDSVAVYDTSSDTTKATKISTASGLLFKALSANDTNGTNVNTAQPWFPTAGSVTVAALTTYFFDGLLRTSRSAGVTSHTTSVLFGGSATLTSILYNTLCNTTDVVTNAAINQTQSEAATAVVVKAASTSATEQTLIRVAGIVRINATGTLIPQFQYSVAPGGTPTVLANSYFRLTPVGINTVTTSGTWA